LPNRQVLQNLFNTKKARSLRKQYFFSPKGSEPFLDKGTVSLVRNILTRRSKRIGSKPQTANPDMFNARNSQNVRSYNSERPGTSPFGSALVQSRAEEEAFPMPDKEKLDPQLNPNNQPVVV